MANGNEQMAQGQAQGGTITADQAITELESAGISPEQVIAVLRIISNMSAEQMNAFMQMLTGGGEQPVAPAEGQVASEAQGGQEQYGF